MLKNKKHSKNFSSAIVLISILGIVLGVSVMILTMSVAEGFQKEIKNKLMGFGSHIQIENLRIILKIPYSNMIFSQCTVIDDVPA